MNSENNALIWIMGFSRPVGVVVGRGLETGTWQCRWYYNGIMISQSWTKDQGKTLEPYPEWGGDAPKVSILSLSLGLFLTLESKQGENWARDKEKFRSCVLEGRGYVSRLTIFPHYVLVLVPNYIQESYFSRHMQL